MAADACPVKQYAEDVGSGKILANRWVRLACKRHLKDLEDGPSRGLYFDHKTAMRAIEFFPKLLVFYEGEWDNKPFHLMPWQKFIVGNLFGWKSEDGFRRFRTAYIEASKGAGKTPLASGIGLYGLVMDDEPGCEIYSAATTRDQAGILFRDAKAFVEGSPALLRRLTVDKSNIAYTEKNSYFRPLSSEHRGLDGKRPHIALIDEIHEHPNALVVDKMRAGTKGRRQALIVEITNALSLDTPIPVPSGWATMGTLNVGDQVFDDDGNTCNVVAATDIMRDHKCYRVVFDDGTEIVADAGHLWETTQVRGSMSWDEMVAGRREDNLPKRERRKAGEPNRLVECICGCGSTFYEFDGNGRHRSYVASGHRNKLRQRVGIRSTEEIERTLKWRTYANHRVRLCKSLNLPEADLPIDPYVLGCWLGDGNSKDAAIVVTDGDLEIVDNIVAAGVSVGRRRQVGCSPTLGMYGIGVTGRGRQDSLHCTMKREGLLRNKHIPPEYLRASIRQRSALLHGLMDTDGSIDPRTGRCVFTQSKEELCSQVYELVSSLGIKCTMLHSISELMGKSFDRWDVFFYPPWGMKIFGLERKQRHNRIRHTRKRMTGNRRIVDVQPVSSVPVRCISVDSPSHLFLAGRSMVPTHNSGYDRHSVCYQHHEHSEKILEGVFENDSWFAYITGLDVCEKCSADGKTIPVDGCPDCDSWKDESKWIKANPSLDVIIPRKYLREQVAEASEMPSKENIVKRLNFNIWTESVTKWLSLEKWNACGDAVDPEALKGRICYGGLDLSSTTDITAWVLVFPPEKIGGKYSVLCRFFIPEDNMRERARRDKVPYDVWVRQGFITATPGNVIDYKYVLAQIQKDLTDYDLAELAFDRWGSQKIITDLQDLGFEVEGKCNLIQFGQGFASMSSPTKELEKMVLSGEIAHAGHPVLAWMVSNTVVKTDPAFNLKPDKERSTEKIDGVVAMIMAISRAMLKNDTTSIYESRGIVVL
jgi:phage terminase large subunit-like protein